ncbi:hypothetical protein OQA88_11035 [Cercophora sp. LCS_1]
MEKNFATPMFQYTPLLGPRNIRVLVLQPALRASDPICCSFQQTSLDEDATSRSPYEAVSYVWGAPSGTKRVLVDGQTAFVTPNCEEALLQLRRMFKPRNLWVDALCIDQSSVAEKNQQVPMMADIYRCAVGTILWLGPDSDPELSGVLGRAARYGGAVQQLRRTFRSIRPDTSYWSSQRHSTIYILNDTENARIHRLCQDRWFSRIWTVQEFLVSKTAVFRMGGVECPAISLSSYYHMGGSIVSRTDLEHYTLRNSLLDFRLDREETFYEFLHLVIKLCALNDATDARDKVYGIFSYLTSQFPDFDLPPVDYQKPLHEVYELFTRAVIARTNSLWVVGLINPAPEDTSGEPHPIPSWVLDLRDPMVVGSDWDSRHTSDWSRGYYVKRPEQTVFKEPNRLNVPGQLRVRARKIGKVAQTTGRMPSWGAGPGQKATQEEMDLARTACLSEWTALCIDLDMREQDRREQTRLEQEQDLAVRRLVAEQQGSRIESWVLNTPTVPLPESSQSPYQNTMEHITKELKYLRLRHEPIVVNEDAISLDSLSLRGLPKEKAIEKALKKKREAKKQAEKGPDTFDGSPEVHDGCLLFATADGHLAQSQGNVRKGDGVYLVEGSTFPMVLRRVRRGKEYTVVGKARMFKTPSEKTSDELDSSALGDDPKARDVILV